MAEVARRRRFAAPVKLPSSTTVSSTRSWSILGIPGACISNFLKRTFRFIRILWTGRNPIFCGRATRRQTSATARSRFVMAKSTAAVIREQPRQIVHRTHGRRQGPITRLMSPSDLGQTLKPFVFLDIFDADESTSHAMGEMPVHPHSGIATVTVFTEGHMRYADPAGGSGKLEYGGVEWMRAGRGVWHGQEMSAGDVPR